MKKQCIAFLLGLCWVIGMIAVFSFPPKIKIQNETSGSDTILKEITGPTLHLRTSFENFKTPPFEIDWRLFSKLNPTWKPENYSTLLIHFAPSYFQKSRALIDHKLFFIKFFYSW